ncbi:MAG: DUF2878 domain-containing protein [Burkholderiaceae bacterium]
MTGMACPAASGPAADGPTLGRRLANFVVFEAAWFAAVLGAAHGRPALGTAAVVAAMAWHLAVSTRPAVEARLLGACLVLGLVVETALVQAGFVAYPSGQPVAWLPPYWLVALWGLFGIALNVTLRWLHSRPVLAAALGAVAGPASFASGVRLGGARFVEAVPELALLALAWAVAMPLLVAAARRLDGVAAQETSRA